MKEPLSTVSGSSVAMSHLDASDAEHGLLTDLLSESGREAKQRASRSATLRALFSYPEYSTKPLRSTAWLDGLRGVAAAEVVLHHFHLRFLGQSYNFAYGSMENTYQWWRLPFIRNYWHSAHAMVNVFFVISGFVLTQRSLSLIRSRQHDKLIKSLSSAVFRRLIRIFSPVIAVTFVGMIMIRWRLKSSGGGFLPIQYHDNIFAQTLDWAQSTEKFLNPFHKYEDQWDILHPYEHVMWTLPLEYYGSIVCYVTMLGVAMVTNTTKRTIIISSIAYLALKRANWWSANFLAGTLLADYILSQEAAAADTDGHQIKRTSVSQGHLHQTFWSVIFLWSFYLCGLPDPKPGEYSLPGYEIYLSLTPTAFQHHENGGRFWWMVAGVAVTVSISQLPSLKRMFETRFCQYLGKISFMMYLIHTYCYEALGKYLLAVLQSLGAGEPLSKMLQTEPSMVGMSSIASLLVYLVFWALALPALAILSGLATRYIDEPSIRLAKWLETQCTA